MAIEAINSTTYKADDLGDVKPKVVIGGTGVSKFLPNINTSFRFGGTTEEFYININRAEKIVTSEPAALTAEKVIKQTIGIETDEFYIDKNGLLKWDTVYASEPATLKLTYKITYSAGITFLYQDTLENSWAANNRGLTLEQYLAHVTRAEDIVGSYAVYCDKLNNKYKNGKLCHIRRPFVIDSDGKIAWCTLSIKANDMIVTLPKDFMDSAKYPVRLDPSLGMSTIGASSTSMSLYAGQYYNSLADANGTANRVYAYISGSSQTVTLGYYDDVSAQPATLLSSGTVSAGSVAWHYAAVTEDISSGQRYCPALYVPAGVTFYYDDGSSGDSYWGSGAALPNPMSSAASDTWRYSLYLDYTESGGSSPVGSILKGKTLHSLTLGRIIQ